LVSSTGASPAIRVFKKRDLESLGQYYEAAGAAPWAGADWPVDRNLVVFGVTLRDSTATARVARFDPRTGRFLPGSVEIGIGAVQEIFEDREGDLWAVLPWSASLARIHPITTAR